MRVAYFDASSGISGNMVLGALLDAGLSRSFLLRELKKLNLRNYKIEISPARPTLVSVKISRPEKPRTLKDIFRIIDRSKLTSRVKERSRTIFKRLARAEARVHKTPTGKLHFHELGATDAMIDITGSAIALEALGIKKVYSSALNVGKGKVKMMHGVFPVPAPATRELVKGIPIFTNSLRGELVTPTGAAIITAICENFGDMPKIELDRMGEGAGSYRLREPNTLKVFIGEEEDALEQDTVIQMETNIDDMDPKLYGPLVKKLMSRGALDVWITPIRMKKGREAAKLTALSETPLRQKIEKAIFENTTTLGIRAFLVRRDKLKRKLVRVKTKYGELHVKVGSLSGRVLTASPEFRDCLKISKKNKVPIRSVYLAAMEHFPKSSTRKHAIN